METYAVRLWPRGEFLERHLRRADAERYVETFNRIMRRDGPWAELVREGSFDSTRALRNSKSMNK